MVFKTFGARKLDHFLGAKSVHAGHIKVFALGGFLAGKFRFQFLNFLIKQIIRWQTAWRQDHHGRVRMSTMTTVSATTASATLSSAPALALVLVSLLML